jgi:hypothetical protein
MFRELEPLLGSLADHVSSAESPDGLLTRVEVAIGRNHDVSAARRLHRTATQQAAILSRTLGDAGVDHTDEEIQSIASRLGSAIRRHHEIEADLLLDAFEHEVGVGD